MIHKMLRLFIVKVFVLGYSPLHKIQQQKYIIKEMTF